MNVSSKRQARISVLLALIKHQKKKKTSEEVIRSILQKYCKSTWFLGDTATRDYVNTAMDVEF